MLWILSAWQEWRERRQILRELRRQESDDSERLRFTVKDQLTHALSALERDDHRQATEIWTSLLGSAPREARASPLAIRVLLWLHRYDEAEAIMLAGRQAHPRDAQFLIGLARVAQAREDHETTIQRCADLRKQFTSAPEGYTLAIESLVRTGQLEQADRLAERGMKVFPHDEKVFLCFGPIANERQDWAEALRRWQLVIDRFEPQIGYLGLGQAAYRGLAETLRHLGRYDEAEKVLSKLSVHYPLDPTPRIELARLSQKRGNGSEAIHRWQDVAQRFPLYFPGCLWAAEGLETLGATTEAENVLRAAIDHFPTNPRPLIELGWLMTRRGDFTGAIDVWATLRQTFPGEAIGYEQGIEALLRTGRPEEANALRKNQHAG